jgi:dTDP-4-amino-4,6-dideoxygalactose transaminase
MGLIKLPKQSIQYFQDNIEDIYESGLLAEGPWNKKLSEFVCFTTGATCAIPVNSNGAGIVALLNIYKHYFNRNHVLIQSNTMYGVKTMVPSGGCQLEGFIECQLETLMPDFDDVKTAIEKLDKKQRRGLIILLSHIGGIINPDIQAIADLCKQEDIILLEDCAHSFAATLNKKHSGLFGNAGVYSFYSTKAIPAGEGGMVVTNDEELGKLISNFGIYDRFEQKMEIGFNNRISEMQALLTYSVVKEWEYIFDNKRRIADHYIKVCQGLGIPFISQDQSGQDGNYYKFTVYNKSEPISQYLPELKTTTSPVYDYSIGVNNRLAGFHACLPIWYGQEIEITEKVVDELYESFKK